MILIVLYTLLATSDTQLPSFKRPLAPQVLAAFDLATVYMRIAAVLGGAHDTAHPRFDAIADYSLCTKV